MRTVEVKAEARRLGLRWEDVRSVYCQLRERQQLQRQWKWSIRGEAWYRAGFNGHGGRFKMAFRRAFRDGDCDMIPGFDRLAQSMAGAYPELAGDGDPTQKLWDLISEPFDRMPPAADTYREAMELLLDGFFLPDDTPMPEYCNDDF